MFTDADLEGEACLLLVYVFIPKSIDTRVLPDQPSTSPVQHLFFGSGIYIV